MIKSFNRSFAFIYVLFIQVIFIVLQFCPVTKLQEGVFLSEEGPYDFAILLLYRSGFVSLFLMF